MATTTKLITYEEWLTMPEVDDAIEEVVNGEIVTVPPPKAHHGDIVESLADILRRQIDPAQLRLRISVFGLVIRHSPLSMRVPDLAMFPKANIFNHHSYIPSPPQLRLQTFYP